MNQERILESLPYSAAEGKSLAEIAEEIGLDTSSHASRTKARRDLSDALRRLMRWGLVASDRRQRCDGHKFWYKVYWRIEDIVDEEPEAIDTVVMQSIRSKGELLEI